MNDFVISSGHGKIVRGASGFIDEVDEARKVVNKVTDYLKELNCSVDKFHDDTSKTQSENLKTIVTYHDSKNRELDISIHFNAATKTNDPRGVEVLYVSDSVKVLAEKLVNAISSVSSLKNRGIKFRDNLYFLNQTDKPAILIEVCFVDSKADVDIYHAKFNQICQVIAETLSGKKLSDVVKPKPTPKPIVKPTPKPKFQLVYKRTLKEGMEGNDVKQLQIALNKLNFKCGKEDSDYGKKVKDAVTRFQKVYLAHEVDGKAGKNTISKINSLLK
jgi:N-acetylmuramoyl-L-alanine amidase